MTETFHFPNNEHGKKMRANLAKIMREGGREVEETEEVITITVLKLKVGKRPGEGQIAANMKERKTVREFIAEE